MSLADKLAERANMLSDLYTQTQNPGHRTVIFLMYEACLKFMQTKIK